MSLSPSARYPASASGWLAVSLSPLQFYHGGLIKRWVRKTFLRPLIIATFQSSTRRVSESRVSQLELCAFFSISVPRTFLELCIVVPEASSGS